MMFDLNVTIRRRARLAIPTGLFLLLWVCVVVSATAGGTSGCASTSEKKETRRPRRYDGPIIDLHAHFDPAQSDAFIKNAADPRVFRIGALVIAAAGRPDATRANNDRLIALAQENPKIVPVASVHPHDGAAALAELDRLYKSNVRAIALHITEQGFALDDPRTHALVAKCAELGLITMIEAGPTTGPGFTKEVLALAVRHKTSRLVLLHTGGDDVASWLAFDAAKRDSRIGFANNVWFDVSAAAATFQKSPFSPQLAWVIERLRDRVVFGSEFPIDSSTNVAEAVAQLGLSEADAGGVLYTNSARLLGL
jgi:predicted TIM-barrel fold metal-dependent hydrolase